ncbi:hypothetical protein SY83_02325 [Paenibacillus swuensis]|uniref:DUF4352 domain-containing protein n=1 Tax=Paenibacillus swuensis TaxID=1178515 RepID=A0A172TEJ8_9BACL|nr:hypothetical protein [Paenibacillus swuensis]ANE45356.1 hypothetical protein SY83_02325 [Paenibacillus swuensis]
MNTHKYMVLSSALILLLMASACSNQTNNAAPETNASVTTPENEATGNNSAETEPETTTDADKDIQVVIDQIEKPIEGNSFDFAVKQLPKGFALAEMQWLSKDNMIINSVQDAIANGASGADGFYISGNGQMTGFFYPDSMKGETGKIVILFKDEQGEELTWKKELTLK